jgi:hypothetical protein
MRLAEKYLRGQKPHTAIKGSATFERIIKRLKKIMFLEVQCAENDTSCI